MAKVNIIRWDDVNYLPKILDETDTAMANFIDVTGSGENLYIGAVDASSILLGKTGGSLIVSGSSLFKGILTASIGAKITGSVDLPGQQSFKLDGVAVTTDNFTALNLSRLFNGSNVDDLHLHSLTASLSGVLISDGDFVHTFTANTSLSGTQVVYLKNGPNVVEPASVQAVASSRIIGIVSGSTSIAYNSGSQNVKVYTLFGDRFDGFVGLTASSVYYLDRVSGSINTTPPIGAGAKSVVQVGIAASNTELIFQPLVITRLGG